MIPLRGIPAEERLISRHEPIVISDLTVEAVKDLGSVAQVLQRFHIQSILIVPIISEGRVVGSFSPVSYTHLRPCKACTVSVPVCA